MTDQPTVTLNDGHVMPQFGLGVFQMPAGETADIVASALELGYRAVDTAAIYRNEEGVGRAVRAVPQEVFVTTKLWNSEQGYDSAMRAHEESMRKLGLDWLDLYLIHWPCPDKELFVDTWKAFVRLKEEGRVKSIGVSNFREVDLERIIDATGVVPATNQIELHPWFQQVELRAFHEENGIRTTSWSPLGQGKALADAVLAEVARKHGKTPAQVILRWHLDSGLIVIPKSAHRERQAENVGALGFKLDAEDMAVIAGMDDPEGRIGPDPSVFC